MQRRADRLGVLLHSAEGWRRAGWDGTGWRESGTLVGVEPGMAPRRRRRGRGCLITFIVLVVVVLGLLLAADRVGHSVADDKVADQLAQQAESQGITLGKEPTADITGFPFLTQVAADRYDKVVVHLRDLAKDGYSLPKLDVTATGVHAKTSDLLHGRGPVTADRIDGTATIGYGYLQKTAQHQMSQQAGVKLQHLTLSNDGSKLAVHARVSLAGRQIKLAGAAKLSLSDRGRTVHVQVLNLKPQGVTLPAFAQDIVKKLADQLSTDVKLPDLPYHLRLTTVTPGADGLRASASATHVTLVSAS